MKIFLVLIFAAQFYFCVAQDIKEKVEDIINSTLGPKVIYEYKKFLIPADVKNRIENDAHQKFYGDYVYIYKINKGDQLKAIAILDNVYGKEQPITFMVIIDSTGSVISSEIIKYREPYGGAVQNKSWNDQFKGKNSNSGFDVGQDIDGISGATISVKSVTRGIQKVLLLYDLIKNDL